MRGLPALFAALGLLACAGGDHAAAEPRGKAVYGATADPERELARALDRADRHKPVLVVFGADWCADCLAFDRASRRAGLDRQFVVVKVDVGRFDKNEALAARLGVALENGIPTVAVIDGAGRTVFATKAGELANARAMGDEAIAAFFARKFE